MLTFNLKVRTIDSAILIACEESQVECMAWRNAGYYAFSCDIQPCSGLHPEYHIRADVLPYLNGLGDFVTEDGQCYHVERWQMIISHPPCTFLTAATNLFMYERPGILRFGRYVLGRQAAWFFYQCLNAECDFLCVENPRPYRMWGFPKPSQRLDPSEFGHKWTKRTYYWLRNLPPLLPTLFVSETKAFLDGRKGSKNRSKSFPGIAMAMTEQWADYVSECKIRE